MITRIILICAFVSMVANLNGQNLDINILKHINTSKAVPSDPFFKFTSNSAAYVVLAVPATLGVKALLSNNKELFRQSCAMGASVLLAEGITYGLKYTINRKRPFKSYPFIMSKSDIGDPSFPSGHTSAAFATATSLSLAFPKWYVIVPAFAWAGTVAYSRMHLGVHYPSDVLGGIVIGAGSAYITFKANIWLTNKYYARKKATE
jgi:membrane-associated phospholipid phosphatase